jgi:peptidoglycan biosynthesis protein MviN/MurJ (putative lipid II flippase)
MSRQHFFFSLGALAAAVLLILAAAAFGPSEVKGVGLGIGTVCGTMSLSFTAVLRHHRRLDGHPELRLSGRVVGLWSLLGGATAAVAIWEVVGAAAFAPNVSRWLTLANGLVVGTLACAGLVAHEICTERVVHVLEVVERPPRELT